MTKGSIRKIIILLVFGTILLSLNFSFLKRNIQFSQLVHIGRPDPLEISFSENKTNEKMVENEDILQIKEIFRLIEDEEEQECLNQIEVLLTTISDQYLEVYFEKFFKYLTGKKKNRNPIYFFNEMGNFQKCLTDRYGQNEINARDLSEIIPFYLLKKYETHSNNCAYLCEIFLNYSIKDNRLSKKAAIVICLKVRTVYEDEGIIKTGNNLKELQKQITDYIQSFPNEFSENKKFKDEKIWLEEFNEFLTNRINNPIKGIFGRISYNKKIIGLGE